MVSLILCSLIAPTQPSSDPNEALAKIESFRQQEFVKTPKPRPDSFNLNLASETKRLADDALADYSLATINTQDGLAWIKLLEYAERYPLIPPTYEKFLASAPPKIQSTEALNYALNSFGKSKTFSSGLRFISSQPSITTELANLMVSTYGNFALRVINSENLESNLNDFDQLLQKITPPQSTDEQKQFGASLASYYCGRSEIQFKGGAKDAALDTLREGLADPRIDDQNKSQITLTQTRLTLPGSSPPKLTPIKQIGKFENFDSLRGKVIVINFFANWSNFSLNSFNDFRSLNTDLKPNGLEIIGVTQFYKQFENKFALEEGDELLLMKSFATDNKLTWPILFATPETFVEYGVQLLPYSVLIDRRGVVRKIQVGYDRESFAEFRILIEAVLKETVESPPPSAY
ncbi:MAG: peroxiredoxin family protein [Fimbriimonadaceae bacterium]